jgi:hypothetical protein
MLRRLRERGSWRRLFHVTVDVVAGHASILLVRCHFPCQIRWKVALREARK